MPANVPGRLFSVLTSDLVDCVLANLAPPRVPRILCDPERVAMSWSELERLLNEAEADAGVRRSIKSCHFQQQLILEELNLDYRIPHIDLERVREIER